MTYNELILTILREGTDYLDTCLEEEVEPGVGDFGLYLIARNRHAAPAHGPRHESEPDEFMQELLVRVTEYIVWTQTGEMPHGSRDATLAGFGDFVYGEYDDHDVPLDARTIVERAHGMAYNGYEEQA